MNRADFELEPPAMYEVSATGDRQKSQRQGARKNTLLQVLGAAHVTEAQITKHVMERWNKMGLPNTIVASIPNMGARGQYGLTRGLPDLLCIGPGFVGFLELKTEKGRVSKDQRAFKSLCVANGIPHSITYGLEQAVTVLEHWKMIRRAA